jgi:uncharacterized protein (TIGR02145 family)
MRNKLNKIAMAAGFVLAITFTISCSSDGGGNNPPGSNPGTEISSSEGGDGSSSSSSSPSQSNGSGTGASSSAEDNGSSNPGNDDSQSYDYCIMGRQCYKNFRGDCTALIALYGSNGGWSNSCPSSYICTNYQSGIECQGRSNCGASGYNPETQFCSNFKVYEKCNGKTYSSPEKYVCCNGETYDIEKYICVNGALALLCGSSTYDPKTQYCSNGVVKNDRYGTLTYNGQTYKTVGIGTQNWMAENLNYNAEDSECLNLQASCNTYGRLYNRETAMAVCPSGWHLPSIEEWDTLINFVGDAKKLMATSGWNDYHGLSGSGTDEYGFSALPVCSASSCPGSDGSSCVWWTSSIRMCGATYTCSHNYAYVSISDSGFERGETTNNSRGYSVRCLQD